MALAKIKSASAALNLTMTPRHVTGMNQDISAVCYSGLDASHLASRTLFSKRKATRNQWETLKTWVWDRSLPVQKLPGNKNHKKKQGKFYNSAFSKSATPQKPSIQQSTILAAAHRSHHELTNQPELLKQPLPMMPKNHLKKKTWNHWSTCRFLKLPLQTMQFCLHEMIGSPCRASRTLCHPCHCGDDKRPGEKKPPRRPLGRFSHANVDIKW